MPTGLEIVRGQANRVPEPAGDDFIVFTAVDRRRIETNVDSSADVFFQGSISGTVMTVSLLHYGTISAGAELFGTGVIVGSSVVRQLTGLTGGTGTYIVTPTQTVISSPIACGAQQMMQATEITFHIDVYGPNAADNAQIITTLFRDEYSFEAIQALNSAVAPLSADDPKQIPFISGEEQYQDRWVVVAFLQADQVVSVPLQYADIVDVTPVSVEAEFPAT
jgi:hypothetical protein